MTPLLKAPGTSLLKLRYDEPVSNVAVKFNLRRYTVEDAAVLTQRGAPGAQQQGLTLVHFSAQRERFVWDMGCA
jgi:hypothetical protein